MKLLSLFFVLTVSVQLKAADTLIDPSTLKLKVYKMAASLSPLCTDLVTIFENSSPIYTDILGSPQLGSGTIANGTYPCVVIEFSDNIKHVPNANSTTGNCVAGQEETQDVCSSGASVLIDGTNVTCTSGDDRVAMYLSTASTQSTGSDAFSPPQSLADASYGFNLASALVVSGDTAGSFIVNGTDQIRDSGGQCEMMPPSFLLVSKYSFLKRPSSLRGPIY